MALKFLLALGFVTAASAGHVANAHVYHSSAMDVHAAPATVADNVVINSEEYDSHPQYKYSYDVEDKRTGDSKSQVEERDGDSVRGEYSLVDADGYKRTVKYTADDHNGFNAVVEREPLVHVAAEYAAPTVDKAAAPVNYLVSPTLLNTVAPVVHYSAPRTHHYSAPAVVKTPYALPAQYSSYDVPPYNYHY